MTRDTDYPKERVEEREHATFVPPDEQHVREDGAPTEPAESSAEWAENNSDMTNADRPGAIGTEADPRENRDTDPTLVDPEPASSLDTGTSEDAERTDDLAAEDEARAANADHMGARNVDSRDVDDVDTDGRNVEAVDADGRDVDGRDVDGREVDAVDADGRNVGAVDMDTNNVDSRHVDSRKVDVVDVDFRDVDALDADTRDIDPRDIDAVDAANTDTYTETGTRDDDAHDDALARAEQTALVEETERPVDLDGFADDMVAVGTAHVPEQSTGSAAEFWPSGLVDDLRSRWDTVQMRFVDDPSGVATDAKALVGEAVTAIRDAVDRLEARLEEAVSEADNDTEQLRQRVAHYRDVFESLLRR